MLKELYEILEYDNRLAKRLSDFGQAQKNVEFEREYAFRELWKLKYHSKLKPQMTTSQNTNQK